MVRVFDVFQLLSVAQVEGLGEQNHEILPSFSLPFLSLHSDLLILEVYDFPREAAKSDDVCLPSSSERMAFTSYHDPGSNLLPQMGELAL